MKKIACSLVLASAMSALLPANAANVSEPAKGDAAKSVANSVTKSEPAPEPVVTKATMNVGGKDYPVNFVHVKAPPPDPRGICAKPEAREFDFWLGEWDVYDEKGALQGADKVEVTNDNCTLLQTWKQQTDQWRPVGAPNRYHGMSMTTFTGLNKGFPKWSQVWTDNGGVMLLFTGEKNDKGEMVLQTKINHKEWPETRYVYAPQPDGTMVLTGTYLMADGKEQPAFKYLYKRRSGTTKPEVTAPAKH